VLFADELLGVLGGEAGELLQVIERESGAASSDAGEVSSTMILSRLSRQALPDWPFRLY
jgi:hypothetical protein